jgi:hypothetical protein
MMRKTRKRNIKKRKTQKRIFFGGNPQKFKLLILDSDQINSIYNNIDDDIKLYIRTLVDEKAQYYKINKEEVKQKVTNTSLFKLILIKPMYN